MIILFRKKKLFQKKVLFQKVQLFSPVISSVYYRERITADNFPRITTAGDIRVTAS